MIRYKEKQDIKSASRAVALFSRLYLSLGKTLNQKDLVEVSTRLTEAIIASTFISIEADELIERLGDDND